MRVSFLFYYYTKSRALPNSITIAFSTPKLAKPPALLPPPPHLAQSFLDPGTEGFRASRSKNQNLGSGKRGGAVTGSGGNAPPLQLLELAIQEASRSLLGCEEAEAPQISPPRAPERQLPAPEDAPADPTAAAAGGEEAAAASS
jgi:hypothetical protein